MVESGLAAEPDALWRHAVSPSGVNYELEPLLRMTFPRDVGDLTIAAKPGQRLFRSWLLAGGVVPIEYDDVVFEEVEPGRRFLERSSMWTQRMWEHERIIEPAVGGCRVTDRIRFEPRWPRLTALYVRVFRAVFRWRHRRLRSRFGESTSAHP